MCGGGAMRRVGGR
uniref:Uncharacterized protein n=1 Tax=Arundo donax TaxID=35708 RepID=A0A0A9B0T7_ARUDO